jgi:hypothetical protein
VFKLTIDTDNAAFEDGGNDEVARILRKLADRVEYGDRLADDNGACLDANGNRVGTWELTR